MKIHSLSYEDLETGWKIENVQFGELNLLVGASGVGKTMILKVITEIALWTGRPVKNSVQWSISFETEEQKIYSWSGKTIKNSKEEASFEWEKLVLDEKVIAERHQNGIVEYHGEPFRRLNSKLSVIDLVEEDDLLRVKYEMSKVRYVNHDIPSQLHFSHATYDITLKEFERGIEELEEEITGLDDDSFRFYLRDYSYDPVGILYILQQRRTYLLEAIKADFIEIFPTVEDMFIEPISDKTSAGYQLMLYIKELGSKKPIPVEHVSSGMLRTLLMLMEVHLCPSGTLLLIDEVENGLGVNCMDDIIRKLLLTYRDLQFILTSHHPYIINNIHHNNWRLVTRNGSQVVVQPIGDLIDMSKSKQESFIQLVQLEQFHTGIATVE